MPPSRLGPIDLLAYNATYGVIICRECQYAIQKSALRSHLLRHKIFRHKRHSLLSSISQFDILEPEDVRLPPPSTRPIENLPVIAGFRCVIGECESMYASSKRMRRHQLDSHDIIESEGVALESTVRLVSLQTFFRGTKIRYFEVAPLDSSKTLQASAKGNKALELNPQSVDNSMHDIHPAVESESPLLTPGIDLQHLGYFHHFLSETSLTLPSLKPKQSEELYWHHEFVAQALKQSWLMAGLLALAASHKASAAQSTSISAAHHERSTSLYREFEEGRKEYLAKDQTIRAMPTTQGQDVLISSHLAMVRGKPTPRKEVLDQLSSTMSCAHASFHATRFATSITLDALITSMRRLVDHGATQCPGNFCEASSHDDDFGRAARLMGLDTADRDPNLSTLLASISSLPARMAEALGRPNNLQSVIVALSGIAKLIDSCVTGFESDEMTFWAMATWLAGAAEEFHSMVARDDPAALIVLAHWAASLVRRVEENGCWFLKGAADFILAQVRVKLPDDPAIQALVAGL